MLWMALGLGGPLALLILLNYPAIALGIFASAYILRGGVEVPAYLNPTALSLAAVFASITTYVALKGRVRFRASWYDWCVVGMVMGLLIGSLYSPRQDPALVKTARFVALVAVPYFFARLVLVRPGHIKAFGLTISLSAITVAVPFIATATFSGAVPQFLADLFIVEGRARFLDTNPVPLGTFFVLGAVFLFALTLGQRRGYAVAGYAGIVTLLYATFLTGTRGPILAIGVVCVVYIASVFVRNPSRATSMMLLLSVVLLAVIATGVHETLPNWGRFEAALQRGADMSVQIRENMVVTALDTFVNEPLWGAGTASLPQYPHNILVELAAENGLLGLIPFLGLLYLAAKRAWALLFSRTSVSPEQRHLSYAVLLPLIAVLVIKQFSFELTMHKDLFIMLGAAVNLPMLLADSKLSAVASAVVSTDQQPKAVHFAPQGQLGTGQAGL